MVAVSVFRPKCECVLSQISGENPYTLVQFGVRQDKGMTFQELIGTQAILCITGNHDKSNGPAYA